MRFDPKQWNQRKPYPPLGTLYAASWLRASGHQVALFDVMFAEKPDEIIPVLDQEKPQFLVLYDDGFNYLTKMCLTNMRDAAFEMARLARERGCTIIVSSSDSTDHYEKYLAQGADFVIRGEGEITLLELVNAVQNGDTDYMKIQGIAWKKNGQTCTSAGRTVLRNLDSLPVPAWDLVDIRPYKEAWSIHGYFSLNMATTRGCPYKCNWCAKPIYGNRYNSHSPARIAEELELLRKQFSPDHIWFCDDIFGLKPGWVQEFSHEVEKRGIRTPFMIQSRVDLIVKEDTSAALARAGCETVWLGAESGSQGILDAMDKGTTQEEIRGARALLKKHGIRAAFFLQFGYPGETDEDIQATFRMLAETMPDDIGVSVSYPLPGTPFYERVKSELGEKSNWTDSDELALMFRNHHSPEFYKRLHRFVHKYYRKLQAFESFREVFRNPFRARSGAFRRALSALYYIPAAFLERRKLGRISK